jgi:hypothetical protein
MTLYLKKLRWWNTSPAARWRHISRFIDGAYADSTVERAIARLINGDVTQTAYGVRVAVNESLDDDRSASGATAYWPQRKPCLCRSKKMRGECSHECAVELFRFVVTDNVIASFAEEEQLA